MNQVCTVFSADRHLTPRQHGWILRRDKQRNYHAEMLSSMQRKGLRQESIGGGAEFVRVEHMAERFWVRMWDFKRCTSVSLRAQISSIKWHRDENNATKKKNPTPNRPTVSVVHVFENARKFSSDLSKVNGLTKHVSVNYIFCTFVTDLLKWPEFKR